MTQGLTYNEMREKLSSALRLFPLPSGNNSRNCDHWSQAFVKLTKKMKDETLVYKATNKRLFLQHNTQKWSLTQKLFCCIDCTCIWSGSSANCIDDPFGKKCSPDLVKIPQLSILPQFIVFYFPFPLQLKELSALCRNREVQVDKFHFLTGRWQSHMKISQDAAKFDLFCFLPRGSREWCAAECYSRQLRNNKTHKHVAISSGNFEVFRDPHWSHTVTVTRGWPPEKYLSRAIPNPWHHHSHMGTNAHNQSRTHQHITHAHSQEHCLLNAHADTHTHTQSRLRKKQKRTTIVDTGQRGKAKGE